MRTNILQYLEDTVLRVPDKLAFSDGVNGRSFAEVSSVAQSIGSYLSENGYSHEPVIMLMDKSPDEVTAFFGAIYAGCFYVALDAEMPPKRISLIFGTLKPRIIICDSQNRKLAESLEFDGKIAEFREICDYPVNRRTLDEIRDAQLDIDPIYIVFTSGSTGVPKGVAACHRSVLDYTEALCEAVGFDSDTVFGNQTPLYFDAPLKEIMPTIKYGATAYLIPKRCFSFPIPLCNFLNEHKINTICWVVSALTMISALGALDKNPPQYLKTVCFGSEVFPKKQYDIWRAKYPDTRFFNLYGPTEATGMSCYWAATRQLEADEPIPVGRPFRNTGIILLDNDDKPANEGEICIRGTCVTLGYYSNAEKTAQAFVQNPLNTAYPELIYRTGDIGKYNEFGELVFLTRKDSQIKHMGHRIELGEIEAAAETNANVSRVCCVYNDEAKKIVTFYTGDLESGELLEYMRGLLPKYMLPGSVRRLESMPLTANCKLDRKLMKEWALSV